MNNAWLGVLLSGLVLPGVGQIIFKRYTSGIIMVAVSLGGLSVMTVIILKQVFAVLAEIGPHAVALDIAALMDMATQIVAAAGGRTFNTAMTLVLICWLISMIDAYIIGRQLDRAAPPH
jgi:hypothetical protein